MRIVQRITLVLFVVMSLLYAGSKLYRTTIVDRTAPVITCSSDTVTVARGEDRSALLKGVTAHDNRDGDLTSQIMIQGLTPLIGEDTAKVTYVVFDKANNMSTYTRTVRYSDYRKPRFSMQEAAVYPVNGPVMLLDRLHAEDVVDGDISGKVCITSQNVNAKEAGVYSVTAQVTNSLGDTDTVKLKLIITDSTEPLKLALSEYIVYLDRGQRFDATQYILADNPRAVRTEGAVNTAAEGMYFVSYTYGSDTVWQTVVVS